MQSSEYHDYLSRCGQDNNTYYDVKIKAAKILLEHVDSTFVTPVFNGSASLRDAAGQMIENVTKSVKRKQQVNETYMDRLFHEMTSQYHLDQRNLTASGNKELGKLPTASRILLFSLAAAWIGILIIVIRNRKK